MHLYCFSETHACLLRCPRQELRDLLHVLRFAVSPRPCAARLPFLFRLHLSLADWRPTRSLRRLWKKSHGVLYLELPVLLSSVHFAGHPCLTCLAVTLAQQCLLPLSCSSSPARATCDRTASLVPTDNSAAPLCACRDGADFSFDGMLVL